MNKFTKPNANIKFVPDGWNIVMSTDDVPADYVKVVRCKDCKWLYDDNECPLRDFKQHTFDDYCSYGERKESND